MTFLSPPPTHSFRPPTHFSCALVLPIFTPLVYFVLDHKTQETRAVFMYHTRKFCMEKHTPYVCSLANEMSMLKRQYQCKLTWKELTRPKPSAKHECFRMSIISPYGKKQIDMNEADYTHFVRRADRQKINLYHTTV